MFRSIKNVGLSIMTLTLLANAVLAGEDLLKPNQKILFLGDSITHKGTYVANFDCWLQFKHADKHITVVNAGLGSETVSGLSEESHMKHGFARPSLHERLTRVMDLVKPNLIFACYGMNCGIYKPLDKDRFEAYKTGIMKLRKVAKQYNAEIVHITPPFYDNHGKQGFDYNDVLTAYSKWLVEEGKTEGWNVIDLHTEMQAKITAEKTKNAKFTVQRDHIHPNEVGHWFMTQSILSYFGDRESAAKADINAVLTDKKKVNAIYQRTSLRNKSIHFQTKPKRPVKKMKPEQAQKKIDELNKLINQ